MFQHSTPAGLPGPSHLGIGSQDGGCGGSTKYELEYRAPWYVRRDAQRALMGLDDRTADREAHSHAAGFRGVERVEDPLHVFGANPAPRVGDCNEYAAVALELGADGEHAGVVHGGHGLHGIRDQVEEHLLELDAI